MPETRVGRFEFQSYMEHPRLGCRDEFDSGLDLFIRSSMPKNYALTRFQRSARFHERAMCVHDNGLRVFRELRLVGPLSFQDDGDLKK